MAKYLVFLLIIAVAAAGIFFLIKNETTDKTVIVEINGFAVETEIADTTGKKQKGLSGRLSLARGKGMLFIFNEPGVYGFWMKDMNFSIDIIWISDGKIVGFVKSAQPAVGAPEIFYPPFEIDKVLELPARSIEELNIKVGDELKISTDQL